MNECWLADRVARQSSLNAYWKRRPILLVTVSTGRVHGCRLSMASALMPVGKVVLFSSWKPGAVACALSW
ncbi:hypothetical protein D3C81_1727480 [compost metagenome]